LKLPSLSTNLFSSKSYKFISFLSINLFILSYFVIAIFWLWGHNFTPIKGEDAQSAFITKTLLPLVTLFGLEQNWGVFSPNVRTDNHHTLVLITLQNGFIKLCEMPRLEKMNILEKFERERFRKMFNDNLPYGKADALLPSLSRFLANAAYSKYSPPARISYLLINLPIPPPQGLMSNKPQEKNKLEPGIVNYFVYGASPDDYQ